MTSNTMTARGFWRWPETRGFSILLFVCGSIGLMAYAGWTSEVFAARLESLNSAEGLTPGLDMTLLFGQALAVLPFLTDAAGLILASALSLPALALVVLRTSRRRQGKWLRTILISTHPLTLALMLCGAGWASVGLYIMWRSLSSLPRRRPRRRHLRNRRHAGLAGTGITLAVASLTVPGFGRLLLPLAAVLFLCAPRHMVRHFMPSFYIALLAPVAMVFIANLYIGWSFGAEWISPRLTADMAAGFPIAALFAITGALLSGPGLLRITHMGGSGPRLAALLSAGFAATATGADPLLVAAMAAYAQTALAATRGEPTLLSTLSFAGGAAVVIGLGAL